MRVEQQPSRSTFPENLMQLLAKTQIKGAFKGCNGHSVYRLANGEAWREALYTYTYHYAYNPQAKLLRDRSTY